MVRRQANLRVFVAMSGGVDSAVAALLLKRQGYDVVGVFMKPWQPRGAGCFWRQDREDALRVAARLKIPLLTWDFSREYGRKVAGPMVDGYRQGLTPNPDVECNRHIKFGLFFRRAVREGADFIATGHYARVKNGSIRTAVDTNKDQTYFLWGIPPAVLAKTLFPIGHLTKSQVRAIARRARLPVADKKDSQGVCFVGDLDVRAFLMQRIKPRKGLLMHRDGRILGMHDGAAYYTIGQRHGMNIRDGGGPYYVLARDMERNIVTVGAACDLYARTARVRGLRWFGSPPCRGERVDVRIRYRAPLVPAMLTRGILHFRHPVRAVAPGQSAVFYRRGCLLGGGILA